jgi:hypothetical protein
MVTDSNVGLIDHIYIIGPIADAETSLLTFFDDLHKFGLLLRGCTAADHGIHLKQKLR